MPILSDRSCCQAIYVCSCYLSKHLLEADRGYMMTFIYYHHAVILDKRLRFTIAQTRLYQSYINDAMQRVLACI